jgi:hypothetical protein
VLTAVGPFLFTRFIIPEAQLSLFLLIALYCLLTGFEPGRGARFYWMWAVLALAVLTKGLIAPVFFLGAAIPYLLFTGQWRRWRALKPVTGRCSFWPSPRPGTSSAAWPIPTRAIPSATTPPSATCTASSTSTSSTSTSCASLAALPARLQQAALRRLLAAAPGLALPVEPLSARLDRRGLEDSPPLDAAPAHDAGQTVDFYLGS